MSKAKKNEMDQENQMDKTLPEGENVPCGTKLSNEDEKEPESAEEEATFEQPSAEKEKKSTTKGKKKSDPATERELSVKGVAFKDFCVQVPMPGHHSAFCIIQYQKGDEITDPYVLNFLKKTDKPVNYV